MKMITRERFDLIKKNWGKIASWAVWEGPYDRSKLNVDDLTLFEDEKILNILNPEVILVGLNISRDDLKGKPAFANFHSDYKYAQEYKLRYVLYGTPFWGRYLTDIIKNYPQIDSQSVKQDLQLNPQIERESIEEFEREIQDLGAKNPIIVALGEQVHEILSRNIQHHKVIQIPHFSARREIEKYKKEVDEVGQSLRVPRWKGRYFPSKLSLAILGLLLIVLLVWLTDKFLVYS
jgi:hypothetical protein